MHWNLGAAATLLGIGLGGALVSDRYERGEQLAKRLILLAGNGEDAEFFDAISTYRFQGSYHQAYVSAYDAAMELQKLKDGEISSAPHLQRFREWCRTLV
jgi:hypothetical protein